MLEEKKMKLETIGKIYRNAATEGAVLLKNQENVLPITNQEKVSLFGRCQVDTYRSGTGSGGAVKPPYAISLLQGCKEDNDIHLNEELAEVYEKWIEENPFDNGGGGWAAEPWFQKEMPVSEELAKQAASVSEKAIFIIGRTAGEDQDNVLKEGSYLLTATEKKNLETITKYFSKVIVLMNTPNVIDVSWIENEFKDKIQGLMFVWQGGMEAGHAIADLLSAKAVPSGKLVDTIAYKIEDYPSTANFGGEEKNVYQEDIYVGYRYFETFAKEKVQYPFGFGLSYSEFAWEVKDSIVNQEMMEVHVEVKNIGNFPAKEVIQLYYSAPQGVLGKPSLELANFVKTNLLNSNESEVLKLSIRISDMASYDDEGITGNKACYVLEAGEYSFYAGNSIRNLQEAGSHSIDTLMITERCNSALPPIEQFKRMKPKKNENEFVVTYEESPIREYSIRERIETELPKAMIQTGDKGIKLIDVKNKKATLEEFIAQLSGKELAVIVRGEGMSSRKVTLGTASAFGGVGECLLNYGIPIACCADGPSGARIETGITTTLVPIGTLLACSFNLEMMEHLYEAMSQELNEHKIDSLLGPGMNIHRHPLNGRNFEYFSEDPYVTGMMASAMLKGLRKDGVEGTVKHFATNNQETKRHDVESVVSERALREIYLKGFEIAVKEGKASSIMTSYNPLNGYWTASSYDLNTTILRNEWGYTGIVMTDWWAKTNDVIEGGEGAKTDLASMVRAQNDLYMVVNNDGAEINAAHDNIEEALENGKLTIGELQRAAINICRFILNTEAMDREIPTKEEPISLTSGEEKSTHHYKCNVEEAGVYDVIAKVYSGGVAVSQSSSNIYVNDEFLTTLQVSGTQGERIEQKLLEVRLESGYYGFTEETTKAGIEIDYIELRKKLV